MFSPKRIIVGILILGMTVLIGVGFVKSILKEGPRQIKAKEGVSEFDAEIENMQKWEKLTVILKKALVTLPKFTPPADGKITPDQMRKYVDMVFSINTAMKLDEQRRPPLDPNSKEKFAPLGTALRMARKTAAVAELIEIEKMLELKLTSEEYQFVDTSVKRAMALAFKNMTSSCMEGQDIGKMQENLAYACVFAGYSEKDENMNFIGKPELIKVEEIPAENYKLFLQYYPWLEYQMLILNQYPFECLANLEGVTKADYNPPKVVHPEDRIQSGGENK